MLEAYCAAKGWRTEVIKDFGSGINYRKKGLNRLLEIILRRKMRRLVITHKDRLLRFGAELIFTLCEIQGIEIVIECFAPPPLPLRLSSGHASGRGGGTPSYG